MCSMVVSFLGSRPRRRAEHAADDRGVGDVRIGKMLEDHHAGDRDQFRGEHEHDGAREHAARAQTRENERRQRCEHRSR